MNFLPSPEYAEPAPWYELGPSGPEPLFYLVDLSRPFGAMFVKRAQELPPHCLSWPLPAELSEQGAITIVGSTLDEANDLRDGWRIVKGGTVVLHGKAVGAKQRLDEYFAILARNPRPFCDKVVEVKDLLEDMGFDEVTKLFQDEGGDPTLAAVALRADLARRRFKLLGDVEKALLERLTLGESI